MNINIQAYQDTALAAEIGILSKFRLRYFREYPYLYVGTEDYEREYLARYIANPTARLLIARDAEKIVGVAIGTMLSTETDFVVPQIEKQLQQHHIQPQHCFYFGEMIFDPEHRSRGIGKQMLELLKNAGKEQGAERFCFLAINRQSTDVRRPVDYTDPDIIFEKLGFEKTDGLLTMEWPTIQPDGRVEEATNRLDFWVDRILSY
jgi:ribosomal protein S18 acetylase RimI-like enzyme